MKKKFKDLFFLKIEKILNWDIVELTMTAEHCRLYGCPTTSFYY